MGQVINIVNQATVDLGAPMNALADACQWYVTACLKPIWNVDATIRVSTASDPEVINILIKDTSDVEGALGYHDLETGLPVGYVFAKTAIGNGELVSVTLAHELAELLVDPYCESLVINNDTGTIYPYEVCDAVEEDTFPAPNGIPVSNFVFPEWFQGWKTAPGTQYDYLHKLTSPFQLASGGYITAIHRGEITTLWGSFGKKARWEAENRKGHRLEELFIHNIRKAGLV